MGPLEPSTLGQPTGPNFVTDRRWSRAMANVEVPCFSTSTGWVDSVRLFRIRRCPRSPLAHGPEGVRDEGTGQRRPGAHPCTDQ